MQENQKKEVSEIFTVPARRCKRCGGLLTSGQAIRDGYGSCCLKKIKQEERQQEAKRLIAISRLIPVLKQTAELVGFEVVGRITLRDKGPGRRL